MESDHEKPDNLLKLKETGSTELWLDSVTRVVNPPSHVLLHEDIMPLANAMRVKVPCFEVFIRNEDSGGMSHCSRKVISHLNQNWGVLVYMMSSSKMKVELIDRIRQAD